MSRQLHFIIGIGRSGTTILSKLLNSYLDVHCMPEANFLVFFLYKYRHKKTFSAEDIEAIFEEIELYTLSHPLVGWNFDMAAVKQQALTQFRDANLSYKELCLFIYRHFKIPGTDKERAVMLIDKNPSYTIFVNKIAAELPDSKFIWIVRDHRANILSRKQSIYLKSPEVAYNATRWKLYNKEALAFYEKHKDKVLLVKYEELVANHSFEMDRISRFLNINPQLEEEKTISSQTININDYSIAEQFRERFIKKYSDLNKDINADRLHVWKEKLSPAEIVLADAICEPVSTKLGYTALYPLNKTFLLKLRSAIPILKGYLDIYKDKLIYYAPVKLKLKRLRARYIRLGFIKG